MFLERPIRAYSVGSRLEHNKRKMRVDMLSAEHSTNSTSRVRAFSVGSRAKVARSDLYKGLTNSTNLMKANSQDIADMNTTINNNRLALGLTAQKTQNALNNNITNNNSAGSSSDVNKKSMSIPFIANGPRTTVRLKQMENNQINQIFRICHFIEFPFFFSFTFFASDF